MVLTAGAGGQGQLGRVGQRVSQRRVNQTLLVGVPDGMQFQSILHQFSVALPLVTLVQLS